MLFLRLNYFYPFLDHVIRHMEERFPKDLRGALLGALLIPANLDQLTQAEERKNKSEFDKELPTPQTFEQEVILLVTHERSTQVVLNSCL